MEVSYKIEWDKTHKITAEDSYKLKEYMVYLTMFGYKDFTITAFEKLEELKD